MEPVFHYLIPVLLLIFFFPKLRTKKVLLLGLLAFIPDFDCLIFGAHRFWFHNLFFILIIFLIFYLAFGKRTGLLSLYFLSSHLLLDLAKPGVALFYPITSNLIYLEITISNIYHWFLNINFGILKPAAVNPDWPHNYLQPWGALVLVFIGIFIIVKIIRHKKVF